MSRIPKIYTLRQAVEKASSYCAQQEHCAEDVRSKLFEWSLSTEEIEQVITELIIQDFINEERFARAFARGKFCIKQWGKRKISYELSKKRISPNCIQLGLQEISLKEYEETLCRLIAKKAKEIKDMNPEVKRKKLISYLLSKGFEYDLIIGFLEGKSLHDN